MGVSLVQLRYLDAVKGFVAVGRRMSVSLGAEDLCISQSAMSKQIRRLEDSLGTRLFQRGWRSLAFTSEGEQLFVALNRSIQQLQEGFACRDLGYRRPVTIAADAAIVGLWLLPRLIDFQRKHPDIELRITTNIGERDLAAEGVDVSIQYGSQSTAPLGGVCLFGESIAPVTSPARRVTRIDSAQELRNHVLLEVEASHDWLTWGNWLAARGLTTAMARSVVRFSHYDLAIQAAASGQGIALGRLELLGAMLNEGRLEVPNEIPVCRSGQAYWLVAPATSRRDDTSRVWSWILESRNNAASSPIDSHEWWNRVPERPNRGEGRAMQP